MQFGYVQTLAAERVDLGGKRAQERDMRERVTKMPETVNDMMTLGYH